MAGGTNAELPVLDSIAQRLSQAADALDGIGKSIPATPNAGAVSALMGAVVAHLAESAGNMVIGMKTASDQVAKSRQEYAARDEAAARSFRGD
jgi:formiminotetrahydrofolate cyclodeaminase